MWQETQRKRGTENTPKLPQEHLQGIEAQKDKKHRQRKGQKIRQNSHRNNCKELKHKKIRNTKKERGRKHAKLAQEHLQETNAQKDKKHRESGGQKTR